MAAHVREYKAISLDDLADIRRFVERTALLMGAPEDVAGDLVMATHEAITNIITHGYREEPGGVRVTIELDNDRLIIRIYDHSPRFDPTKVAEPDISIPLDKRPPGGLGVHMMRSFTDEMSYSSSPSGENELVLVRRLSN
jgi:sigma-B regulation protein RsbU (phosphoserine phosphatase)